MKTNLEIKNESLYFCNIQDKIDYEFIDEIGVFAERFPLKFRQKNGDTILNLKENFKSNIRSSIKIKLYFTTKNHINECFENMNKLYNIKIYTVDEFLYIECVPNTNIATIIFLDEYLKVNCFYETSIYCEKIIDSSNIASSIHYIGEGDAYLKDIIKFINEHSLHKQQWKISIRITDYDRNDIHFYINLLDFFQKNKTIFEDNKIFYNFKKNYLLLDNVKNAYNIEMDSIQLYKNYIEFVFTGNVKDTNLFIALRARQGNIFNYTDYLSTKIVNNSAQIQYSDFNSLYLINADNIDLLIGNNLHEANFISPAPQIYKENKYFQLNNDVVGKIYINGRNALSIYTKKLSISNTKAMKVAVLGTCFSRNALNTMDYFNPDYKKYVHCVFTQFHSRLDSLNSHSAPNELIQYYKYNNEFNHIQVDFKKTFYNNLYESKAEVLVIDLYSDALLNPIQLKNDSIITHNYLIKDNNNLGDFVKNWNINEYITEERLLKSFQDNLEVFMKKATTIIPEKNIILNRGRLAETFKDDDGKIQTFRTINLIKRNNYFWEKLDNIVVSKYPKVKIIDLTNQEYFASKSHPFGFSYSHYEPNYYKHFLNELVKKLFEILLEKQN